MTVIEKSKVARVNYQRRSSTRQNSATYVLHDDVKGNEKETWIGAGDLTPFLEEWLSG